MSRRIQAYFKTENDAEDVRVRLQGYGASEIEVGQVENHDGVGNFLFPLAVSGAVVPAGVGGIGAGGATGSTMGATPGLAAIIASGAVKDNGGILGDGSINNNDSDADRVTQNREGNHFANPVAADDNAGVDASGHKYLVSASVSEENYDSVLGVIANYDGLLEQID
jgi:hypothetical protein